MVANSGGNNEIIEKITKFDASKLQAFLYNFANLIDKVGVKEAKEKVGTIL